MNLSPLFITFFLLHFLHLSVNGEITEFDFGTLSLTSLKLLGDAHVNNRTLRLTQDLTVPNSGSGRVLYKKPIRFRQPGTHIPVSFSTFFTFSIINLNPSSVGGGLAFLLTPNDEMVGDAGGFLGLNEGGVESKFVAVEFDTLMDVEFDDINGNHVGVDLNSLVSNEVCDLGLVDIELKSGNLVNSWIDFDGTSRILNVSVSYTNRKPKQPLLSLVIDLDQFVNDFMFVGFSGSTQGSTEIHSIEWWSFRSSYSENLAVSTPPLKSLAPPPPPLTPPLAPPFFGPSSNDIPIVINTPPIPISPSPSNSVPKSSKMSKASSCHNELCKGNPGAVAGVVTAAAFFLAISAGLLIWVFSKRFKLIKKTESLGVEIIRSPKEFGYKELKLATRGFDSGRIIGNGAFGVVYKGLIQETGTFVAVKRCSHGGSEGRAEFLSELSIIGSLRHRNLVHLQGWCHEKGEILLVYDYMPNGSLDKVLFESRMPLEWLHRRKILLGVAAALAYLHQECENQVIHRDVKTSNIMLDADYSAKLGDFGLARQVEHDKSPEATVAAGTMGYLAPEYLLTGRATEKTDVFSFGAVVLEVASGRRPIEREVSGAGRVGACSNLVDWVWTLHREERLLEVADPRLEGAFDIEEMRRILLVGLICSHPDPTVRPTMRVVVQMLIGEAEVPIVPRSKPSLSFSTSHLLLSLQDSVSDCNGLITLSTSSSDASFNGNESLH
ncbi:L-type lectin-domain containing receptor kinase VIII.1 [Ranunculus cassubicifolius]